VEYADLILLDISARSVVSTACCSAQPAYPSFRGLLSMCTDCKAVQLVCWVMSGGCCCVSCCSHTAMKQLPSWLPQAGQRHTSQQPYVTKQLASCRGPLQVALAHVVAE